MDKTPIAVFWFRRDLRLDDNAGLYHALKSKFPVLPVFIFDKEILSQLQDKDDARLTFIYNVIDKIDKEIKKYSCSLFVVFDKPEQAWQKIIEEYNVREVYTNHDYEPYAKQRDEAVEQLFKTHGIAFNTYKDQVIFEKNEVTKDDGKPYTVYTPYQKKWYQTLTDFYLKAYPTNKYFHNFLKTDAYEIPSLKQLGFPSIYLKDNEAFYHSFMYSFV